jgi:hypothetical protein
MPLALILENIGMDTNSISPIVIGVFIPLTIYNREVDKSNIYFSAYIFGATIKFYLGLFGEY